MFIAFVQKLSSLPAPALSTSFTKLTRLIVLIGLMGGLAACGSRPGVGSLEISTEPAENAKTHKILIATTREKDERPSTYFNGERATEVNYAQAVISIPPSHVPGLVEWPSTPPGDPNKDFVLRSTDYIPDAKAFQADLRKELAKRPKGERDVFLFVHGYNTRYAEALYRFAQVVNDSNATDVPVLFSWASRGELTDYVYDNNSATAARDGLEKTIREIYASGAEQVNIMAHSMGNWVLVETLRQIKLSKNPLPEKQMGLTVLAAPDLDIDVFKSQLRRFGQPERPFLILVSRDDRALKVSSLLAGGKSRVGGYGNDTELAELGAVVIDLTNLESQDSANHAKFAQLGVIAPQLREMISKHGFAVNQESLQTQVNSVGATVGDVIGGTAEIIITAPITILTAPLRILSKNQ